MRSFDPFIYQNVFHEYMLEVKQDEIDTLHALLEDLPVTKEHEHDLGQRTLYGQENVLDIPGLVNLKKQITNILNVHNLLLTNNWAQLYNKNNQHTVHNHPSSVWSGIVYLNPSVASPTIFYDREFRHYTHAFTKNQFLLFPSYIPHEVARVNKDEQRLIISLNTKEKTNENT